MEQYLNEYKGTVLVRALPYLDTMALTCQQAVTHDRYFLDNVAGWILELDRGKIFSHTAENG